MPTAFTVTTTGSPTPSITASGEPAWLTLTDNGDGTATLSGTAPSGQEGDHPFTITASNSAGHVDQAFTAEVGCTITITSANSTTFYEAEAGTFNATATDNCNGTQVWNENGALPAGVTFTDNGNAGATLAGTPGSGTTGDWPFQITINDVDSSTSQNFVLHVGPPLVVTTDVFSATEGASFSGQVAHFSGGSAAVSATVAWGDGTTTAGALVGSTVTGTHTYAEEGSKSVTVSVTDAGTTAASTLAETVADANLNSCDCAVPAIAANEGAAFSGVVGSFTDNDPAGTPTDYTAVIGWGDGTTSSGTVTATQGGFDVSGTHTYEDHCVCSGTLTITDVGGKTTNETFTATIAEVGPLVVTGDHITATAGISFSGKVGSFNDPGSKEAGSDYVVTINWGDGTTTTATLIDPPGILLVDGTHTYANVGTYTITISAREGDVQLFALGTGSATVGALPLTSAPSRPLPIGLFLVAVGLFLAGGGVVAWKRRTATSLVED